MALHAAIQEISLNGCGDGRFNLLHLDNSKCRCDAAPISIGLTRPVEAALTSHHPHKLPQLYMYIYINCVAQQTVLSADWLSDALAGCASADRPDLSWLVHLWVLRSVWTPAR